MFKKFVILMLLALVICAEALTLRLYLEQRDLAARLIRLHVVAASDDPADQARKLRVRDALLPEVAALTGDCADAEAAAAALREALPALERTAARSLGAGETVTASLTWELFPRREYETFSLPAGSYRALRVCLGAGQGHNWWCVAFPSLCLPASVEEFRQTAAQAGLSESEIELVTADTAEVRFKFRLLEWIHELFEP